MKIEGAAKLKKDFPQQIQVIKTFNSSNELNPWVSTFKNIKWQVIVIKIEQLKGPILKLEKLMTRKKKKGKLELSG